MSNVDAHNSECFRPRGEMFGTYEMSLCFNKIPYRWVNVVCRFDKMERRNTRYFLLT
jgi:hypothetical protein